MYCVRVRACVRIVQYRYIGRSALYCILYSLYIYILLYDVYRVYIYRYYVNIPVYPVKILRLYDVYVHMYMYCTLYVAMYSYYLHRAQGSSIKAAERTAVVGFMDYYAVHRL